MPKVVLRENPEDVAPADIDAIVAAAELPSGVVYLLVGDHQLSDECQGLCVPRFAVSVLGDIGGLEDYMQEPWDCGVMLHPKWAVRQPDFPAYFAYLLGHEFGHARTALGDPGLAVMEALIYDVPAVSERNNWRYDELPHERLYDQFGIAIAEKIYGRTQLDEEVAALLGSGIEQDEQRLEGLLSLEPRTDLTGLWNEFAVFAEPYRDKLVERWSARKQSMSPGFTRFLEDPQALWSD